MCVAYEACPPLSALVISLLLLVTGLGQAYGVAYALFMSPADLSGLCDTTNPFCWCFCYLSSTIAPFPSNAWLACGHNLDVSCLGAALSRACAICWWAICSMTQRQTIHDRWLAAHCKCCIKSIDRHNVLIFGTQIDMILFFVIKYSHGFSFVLWATIGLTRKIFQNVNQFFESLYMRDIKGYLRHVQE